MSRICIYKYAPQAHRERAARAFPAIFSEFQIALSMQYADVENENLARQRRILLLFFRPKMAFEQGGGGFYNVGCIVI